jgi:YD repeat-containing protein
MRLKVHLIALLVLLAPTSSQAQQSRTFYGSDGRTTARSHTDSAGSTTFYDAGGRVTGRTATDSAGTTTSYRADGSKAGSVVGAQPLHPFMGGKR